MKFICICIFCFGCVACVVGCGGSAPEDNQVCDWGPSVHGNGSICATAEEATITGAKGE